MLQNIGISEYVLIALAALVLFGPDKLPGIGRKLGQAVRQFRSTAATFMEEITRPPEQRQPVLPAERQPVLPAQSAAVRTNESAQPAEPRSANSDGPAEFAAGSKAVPVNAKPRRAPDPRRLPE